MVEAVTVTTDQFLTCDVITQDLEPPPNDTYLLQFPGNEREVKVTNKAETRKESTT